MKPGYYISEYGNFQVWYPEGLFLNSLQTMECLIEGTWLRIHYTKEGLVMVTKTLEFEFLGGL